MWRRTEEAVTGLTRNQFTGIVPVRGFESLRLRFMELSELLHRSEHIDQNQVAERLFAYSLPLHGSVHIVKGADFRYLLPVLSEIQ